MSSGVIRICLSWLWCSGTSELAVSSRVGTVLLTLVDELTDIVAEPLARQVTAAGKWTMYVAMDGSSCPLGVHQSSSASLQSSSTNLDLQCLMCVCSQCSGRIACHYALAPRSTNCEPHVSFHLSSRCTTFLTQIITLQVEGVGTDVASTPGSASAKSTLPLVPLGCMCPTGTPSVHQGSPFVKKVYRRIATENSHRARFKFPYTHEDSLDFSRRKIGVRAFRAVQ